MLIFNPSFLNISRLRLAIACLLLCPLWVIADETPEGKVDTSAKQEVEKNPSFNVYEFKVDGNTVLNKSAIEQAVYPFLGENKTLDDIEAARTALEKTYQDAGYLTVSVSIPQQEVDKNLVRLQVTEGKIERLRIKDSKYTSLAEIKSRVDEFSEGKVPNFTIAQQQLGTVNRGDNRQVTPVLRPGKSPGKVEVDLKVQDKLPLHGNIELNDKFSPNTTQTRLNGSLRYENLWQKDHSIGISFQVTPESLNETQVVSATYLVPRMNGDYLATYGVISNSDIAAVGDTNVIGKGYILGVRYIHPLGMIEDIYHSITLGADYKNFDESVNLLGSDGFKTPISYSAFTVGYDGNYQGESFQSQLNLALNFSMRGLGNGEQEFEDKRFLAKPNYAFFKADFKHTQKLPKDWSAQFRLAAQLADGPLISAEQMVLGGVDSVRGYLESTVTGDNGVFGSAELRTPPIKKYLPTAKYTDSIKDLYAFTFVDAGRASIYSPLNTQGRNDDLLSFGLGVKFKSVSGMFANLDLAHVLRNSPELKDANGNVKYVVEDGEDRLHFRFGYEW